MIFIVVIKVRKKFILPKNQLQMLGPTKKLFEEFPPG